MAPRRRQLTSAEQALARALAAVLVADVQRDSSQRPPASGTVSAGDIWRGTAAENGQGAGA
jgi:hypothetical protein